MKYIDEFRNPELAESYVKEIKSITTKPWNIMEVCGGQTHSLVKFGIPQLLPDEINMIHGPGCPVCVTPLSLIDKAVHLAAHKGVVLCSFGDMMRVPGSEMSLLDAKANGADVRILYSPLECIKIAKEEPEKEVVFFAVGFETTAPANALAILQAKEHELSNFSILTSHVLVPPAIEAIMNDPACQIDAFLGAGHVCSIMGMSEYYPIVDKYDIPIVVTGFEPIDLLHGILLAIKQLEEGNAEVENQYARIVTPEGNVPAKNAIHNVFDIVDRDWRGIGTIPSSGYQLKEELSSFDANIKFDISIADVPESEVCIAGQVLKGIKKPMECPAFGKECHPENPLGAPMVSSEGACAAYFHYAQI